MIAGIHPFWFWNDRLSAEEIRRQVEEMADQGIRGFFIHPRQGLAQPYLSESFFAMADVAIEAARARGLAVHLYDEYPYPGGVAGGEVVLGHPQYQGTRLVHANHDLHGGAVRVELPRGKVLSVVTYPLNGGKVDWLGGLDLRKHVGMVLGSSAYTEGTRLSPYSHKRYWANEPAPVLETTLPVGACRLFVSVQTQVENHKYWGKYVDVLNPEAVRKFIELTHERYLERYGNLFGSGIDAIFADEVYPGWSDRLPGEFMKEYQYDLLAVMPALQDTTHPEHVRVRYDLERLKYKLFCEAFEEPYSRWCQAHAIAYAGEKGSLRLAQLAYMDIPGCDAGHTKAGAPMDLVRPPIRQNAKATASAAYFYGKQGALCECCHSLGWSATLQDVKLIAEGLLLMGIRYIVPHAFFYSTHALRKHDAPPSLFWQMPYWPFVGRLSRRIDRIAGLFDGTHIAADVLLVEPSSGVPAERDLDVYTKLHELLLANHLDYHVVDTDILLGGRIADGRVHIRDVAAKLVIVPPMQVIEESLREWLTQCEAAGVDVLHCGTNLEPREFARAVTQRVEPSLSIRQDDREAAGVWAVRRVSKERTFWFVLNTTSERLDLDISSDVELREVALDENLPASLRRERGGFRRSLAPFESFIVEAAPAAAEQKSLPRVSIAFGGPCRLRPHGKNLLRMHTWQMSLPDQAGSCRHVAKVAAVPIANQLACGQFAVTPRIAIHTGRRPELDFPELRVRYEYTFENGYDGPVELVFEPESLAGEWRVSVNTAEPMRPRDFAPVTAHVRGSLGADVTSLLRRGENTIRIEMLVTRPDGGLLNALYLAGDFGVSLNPVRLVNPAETGSFQAYADNLLPYYAGVIDYITEVHLSEVPHGRDVLAEFVCEKPLHEAIEVSINGSAFQAVLWEPRCLRLPADWLKAGKNTVTVRVYSTLARSFEGQWFDYTAHECRDVCAPAPKEHR